MKNEIPSCNWYEDGFCTNPNTFCMRGKIKTCDEVHSYLQEGDNCQYYADSIDAQDLIRELVEADRIAEEKQRVLSDALARYRAICRRLYAVAGLVDATVVVDDDDKPKIVEIDFVDLERFDAHRGVKIADAVWRTSVNKLIQNETRGE